MIALSTPVSIPILNSQFTITHDSPILLLGSCFTDAIGQKLSDAGFDTLCNPFGTLFNPISIAKCLSRAIYNNPIDKSFMVQRDGLWHSWLHHTRFSHPDLDTALRQCNESISRTYDFLSRNPLLICTFGTAYTFTLTDAYPELCGQVVANCHKVPAQAFTRRKVSIDEIIAAWQPIIAHFESNDTNILFTVSPIRHLADGAHGNQLSKSTLLLAVDQLVGQSTYCEYFPSYEILLDELRDYRFYARDLCHPSDIAVDIIWQHFQDAYLTTETQQRCRQYEQARRQLRHNPISNNITDITPIS